MKACAGGWCRIRERCQHYNTHDRREPAERLCIPGKDGVKRQMGMPVIVHVIKAKETA